MKKCIAIMLISTNVCAVDADNIFLANAPDLPPSSINLVKSERKKRDSETLNNIKGTFSSVLNETLGTRKKKHHTHATLLPSMQRMAQESLEKKELISKEVHHLLQAQYDYPQLQKTIVSFTFKQAPVRDIIALISKLSKLQFVCDESIAGVIHDLSVKNLTAAQALNLVLSNNVPRLALIHDQGVWRITTKTYACEQLRFQAEDLLEQAYESSSRTMFNAVWNDGFKTRIEKLWHTMTAKDISKLCYIAFDDATKKIFFRGKKSLIQDFQKTLQEIDIVIPQVRIDARVILAKKDFEESLGGQISGIYDRKASLKHFDFVGLGPNITTKDAAGAALLNAAGKPLFSELVSWSLNFIPSSLTPNIKLPFIFGGKDLNTKRLNLVLNAAEQQSEIKTILKPSLLVNSEELAEILVGEEMPQATRLDETVEGQLTNITTINYKDIGMKIRVKPTVAPSHDAIILEIYVENSQVTHPTTARVEGSATTSTFNYTIETSRSKNKVSLQSGQTTLISGLVLNHKEKERRGVPFLQDIPIVGWFFSGSKTVIEDKQLLIFITPTLV